MHHGQAEVLEELALAPKPMRGAHPADRRGRPLVTESGDALDPSEGIESSSLRNHAPAGFVDQFIVNIKLGVQSPPSLLNAPAGQPVEQPLTRFRIRGVSLLGVGSHAITVEESA
jgi:hypothetical protein